MERHPNDLQNPEDHPSALVSAASGARLLDVSPRFFHQLVADGRLPAPIRFGPRCVRWRVQDIEAALLEA